MKKKVYTNGGVRYHFDEKDGKLSLTSLEIFGKEFVFPNGGIPEGDIEQISRNVSEQLTNANSDGEINRMQEIAAFLRGYPEGTKLEDILKDLHDEHLENIDDEEIQSWYDEQNQPDSGTQTSEVESGSGTDDSGD